MAKRKVKTKKKQREKETLIIRDVTGIFLSAFSIFIIITFINPSSAGIIGSFISKSLMFLFGVGAYALPAILLAYAIYLMLDVRVKYRFSFSGITISYLMALSIISVSRLSNSFFDTRIISKAGGLAGSLIGYPAKVMFGASGAYIILGAIFIAGIIIAINRPFSEILEFLSPSSSEKPAQKKGESITTRLKEGVTRVLSSSEKTVKIERPDITKPIDFEPEGETQPEHEKAIQEEKKEVLKPEGKEAYILPPLSLLRRNTGTYAKTVKDLKMVIESTLSDFNIPAKVVGTQEGPTVTTFEVQLEPGVPVRRLTSLQEDLALALATPHIRIITPLPGKSAIGIEVPNKSRELVTLGDLLIDENWKKSRDPLLLAIGKDISGKPFYFSVRNMPHMLIAGATGSGKSVCLNSIILTVLFKAKPDEVKLLLIDPKRVEFAPYQDIPHLMAPVVTDPKQASAALSYMVQEMERRYRLLSTMVARDIESYNRKAAAQNEPELPYIVVIIDELADLMLVCAKEVEESIIRLAQMARAVGIHLIVATQRPSANIITGLIKSNITTRIAFSVSSQIDSRVILDMAGAEKLVGKGDMLFQTQSLLHPLRLQAPYITEEEIQKVVEFVKEQARPEYVPDIFEMKAERAGEADFDDELFDKAVDLILQYRQASTSFLQRRLKIGYARAARIMDMLEARGIVGPQEGAKPREILITPEEWESMREAEIDDDWR